MDELKDNLLTVVDFKMLKNYLEKIIDQYDLNTQIKLKTIINRFFDLTLKINKNTKNYNSYIISIKRASKEYLKINDKKFNLVLQERAQSIIDELIKI